MISSTVKVIGCLFAVCLMVHAQTPTHKTSTSSISGKVTLEGSGVPGITVGAHGRQSGRSTNTLVVTTDHQGNYRIANVTPGEYEVMPAAPQYLVGGQTPIKKLIVSEGENLENVDFALVRGGVITGKVTDADGRPVIEEPVEVFAIGGPEGKPLVLMNLFADPTDDRGVYRLYGLRPGKYRVAAGVAEERMYHGRGRRSVYSQTFHPSTTESSEATIIEVSEGSETTNVDITLRRTLDVFSVHARVVDADTGQPIANATYGLQKFRGNGSTSTGGYASNKLGEIKIDSVTPGKYALYLESTSAAAYAEPLRFEVVDQDIKDLVIKASSGGSVSGVVVFDGVDQKLVATKLRELVIFAHIETKSRHGGSTPSGVVNADGSFKVGGLRSGNVKFIVWTRREGPMVTFEITQIARDGVVQPALEIGPGEQIKGLRLLVKACTGRIRGVVKLENGQIPFSQIHVSMKKVGENAGLSVQLDDRGRFVSDAIAPGVYEVAIYSYPAQGQPVSTKQQVVVTDNQITDITLTLNLKSDAGQGRP